jgi:hypothetical protein
MRLLLIGFGALATAAMVAVSMRLNYIFGASLGQTPERAQAFGLVSVIADCWKATGPIFIYSLVRAHRWPTAAAAGVLWFACFAYAVSSALGLAAQDRTTMTSGRETVRAGYEDVVSELREQEGKSKALPAHRSVGELEAAIAALLAQPVMSGGRAHRTVDAISAACTKASDRTVATCAAIATLRQELAVAIEADRLDQRIAGLKERAARLRKGGGTLSADPQAEILSRVTMGLLSPKEVGFGLILLLAMVIELVSAFGPVVLSAYAEATRKTRDGKAIVALEGVATGRDLSRQGAIAVPAIVDYLAERIEPASTRRGLGADELYADYDVWCVKKGGSACSLEAFIDEFDRVRSEHQLVQTIRKFGTRYYGVQLVAGAPEVPVPRALSHLR